MAVLECEGEDKAIGRRRQRRTLGRRSGRLFGWEDSVLEVNGERGERLLNSVF
jgi:hypothetical protein